MEVMVMALRAKFVVRRPRISLAVDFLPHEDQIRAVSHQTISAPAEVLPQKLRD